LEEAISAISICELHYGLLRARDDEARAHRAARLGALQARFPVPLPVDDLVAREWGRLQAVVTSRGGKIRRRGSDLAIAATANVHSATLLTHNMKDFKIIEDLVRLGTP
jgi:predicted nucleic acid-binding protein